MQWLLDIAEKHRAEIRSGYFFSSLDRFEKATDLKGWLHQLYHQSRDFTSALSMRYALCQDPQFQRCFAKHATEEVDHCEALVSWMRRYEFLPNDESPNHTHPTLETQLTSAYCFRSILRESYSHQVITLNLVSEGVSYDFFSAMCPKLQMLGLHPGHYWQIHKDIDRQHLQMGLELIPTCSPSSPQGQQYTKVVEEIATLYSNMLNSWASISLV